MDQDFDSDDDNHPALEPTPNADDSNNLSLEQDVMSLQGHEICSMHRSGFLWVQMCKSRV